MTEADRKKAAKAFAEYWKDRGDEKSDSQSFWLALVRDVLGVAEPEKFILFEERVKLDHTSFIDGHIPSTHVLIEQKKKGLNLRSPIRQSDGTLLNPFQQAQRYSAALPYSQRPRWIITCNFEEFLIYDMEKPTGEPESILLKDLAFRVVDRALNGRAGDDLAVSINVVVTRAELHHRAVLERPLIVKDKLLAVVCREGNKSNLRVFHKYLQNKK